ncbi:MAG: hypothetical protein KF752_03055 [Pirellulaceae bacterium]|nr:hypothetical protein [Pirellulaceae bacterium]
MSEPLAAKSHPSFFAESSDYEASVPDYLAWFWLPLLLAVNGIAVGVLAVGSEIPEWLQPTLVGWLWGCQFLIGFWLARSSGIAFGSMLIVAASSWLWTRVLQHVTDLTTAECLLVSVGLQVAGWLSVRLNPALTSAGWVTHSLRGGQVRLLDYLLAITWAALAVHSIVRLDVPSLLLIGVAVTLFIGCCYSSAACGWALNDRRPIGPAMWLSILLTSVAILGLLALSPANSAGNLASWILTGPLSVIAAQVFTVLLALGLARQYRDLDRSAIPPVKC